MNISQALKEKNRLAGQIKQLETKVKSNNRYNGDTLVFNTVDLAKQLLDKRAELIKLKTSIAVANVGIAGKLVQLAEAKALLSYYTDLKGYSGPSKSTVTSGYGEREKEVIQTSQITIQDVEDLIEGTQKSINSLQDEVDSYNATTQV